MVVFYKSRNIDKRKNTELQNQGSDEILSEVQLKPEQVNYLWVDPKALALPSL